MATFKYGTFDTEVGKAEQTTRLHFPEGPLGLTWKHSGITSDFIGSIVATRYRDAREDYNQVRHDVGYLANELLENTIKFRAPGDVVIDVSVAHGSFRLAIVSKLDAANTVKFKSVLDVLGSESPGELLLKRIEANALSTDGAISGLGLLTLLSDYEATLEWIFDEDTDLGIKLTTHAAIAIPATQISGT
jgi:hypothetical protein